jgi:hypothetical protein
MGVRLFITLVFCAALVAGCASSTDIKPGQVSGIDKRGYVKTTEGFGHVVTRAACPDAKILTETLETVKTIRPNDWRIGKALVLLDADERAGRIHAEDPRAFVGTTSYIGVFVHRLSEELRLIEVSAQWKNRMAATENPWEGHLLQEIGRRLHECLVPPEQAIIRQAQV